MSKLHNPDNLMRDKDRDFLGEDGYYWFSFVCPSESRAAENHRHVFQVREDGAGAYCSCPYATNGGACTLMLCAPDIARGALESESNPPPADPGGTKFVACERCAFEDVCREHGCAHTWPRAEAYAPEVTPDDVATAKGFGSGLVPPADPGEGAARDILRDHLRKRLDRAVAEGGHRWIRSRTKAGVRLTCVACHAVRGWASEGLAAAWLEGGGACGCNGDS